MIETLSEGELTENLLRELRWGRQVKQSFEQIREADAGREAFAARGHKSIPGLGKLVSVIPAYEYFTIGAKYGIECWNDREFVKDNQRLEPTGVANKL